MSGLYSDRMHEDDEDDDEELCMSPSHGADCQPEFADACQRWGDEDLQFTPNTPWEQRDSVVDEKAIDKKKKASGSYDFHSIVSDSQVASTAFASNPAPDGRVDNEPPFEANFPPVNVPVTPSETLSDAQRNVAMPGAFHDDGRNARDVNVDDAWSTSIQPHQSVNTTSDLDLVSAEAVDPNETQRIVERELAEQRRHAPVAEIVKGYWCSPRVKRLCIVVVLLVIVAIVLGTVLPRVLEPPEPTPAPTAAPTDAGPYLEREISSISPDGGEALRTESTPQNQAIAWLVNNTYLGLYPLDKKIQRYVLATLYFSTNGNNWKRRTLWLSDDDECGWYNEAKASFCIDSEVVDLDLFDDRTGNNLVGTIPNEISLLSNSLEELRLADNTLMGSIPSEIGELSNLNELSLWNNSITGTLPSEIGSLAKLTWVNLRVNGLTGTIVSEIGLLTNLKVLSFSMNKLTGMIPTEIGLLTRLDSLYLYGNKLTGRIPSEINLLTKLTDLSLYDNSLTGDYTCWENITNCLISCANDMDQCRSQGADDLPEPSSIAPIGVISVPPTLLPSMNANTPSILPTTNTNNPADLPFPLPVDPPTLVAPIDRPISAPTSPPQVTPSTMMTDPPELAPSPSPTKSPLGISLPTQRPSHAPSLLQPDPPIKQPTLAPIVPRSTAPTNAPWNSRFEYCGDGLVNVSEEECEPSIEESCPDGQFCDDNCRCAGGCGNGQLDEGEECDYAADPTGCDVDRFCDVSCECSLPRQTLCGNGVIDDGEECEPNVAPFCRDGQYCSDECLCVGCGNGRIDEGEECDDTAEPSECNADEFCDDTCRCASGRTDDYWCGDGVISNEEECEPGIAEYACLAGQICDLVCKCTSCGNGQIDDEEECDYAADPTGCEEAQYCDNNCKCTTCGNGQIDDGEKCDYSAESSGCLPNSYCNSTCEDCVFDPSILCNNGILDAEFGEECEPGVPPDCPDGQLCDSYYCTCTTCGNGQIDDGEECDWFAESTGCGEDEYCSPYSSDLCTCVPYGDLETR